MSIDYENKIYKIHFGHPDYDNYTIHKDKERKRLYILRHRNDDTQDTKENVLTSSGWWALVLLWSKPDFDEAYRYAINKARRILSK